MRGRGADGEIEMKSNPKRKPGKDNRENMRAGTKRKRSMTR
jgi:hypothetical protein